MHASVQILGFNLDELRARLHKMSDHQLREFGEAARYMVSSQANLGKPPLPIYEAQLEGLRRSGGGGIRFDDCALLHILDSWFVKASKKVAPAPA
jgi:hypothetical protein